MAKQRRLPVARPSCPCGRVTWFQGEGSGRFKRNGTWATGRWFRFSCPNYRSGSKGVHLHEVVDIQGRPIELTRRNFHVEPPGGRPRCSGEGCREPLTAARMVLTVAAGEHRYFVCRNIRCEEYSKYRAHLRTDQGWKRVTLARGPRVRDFGIDRCPDCGEEGMLRSRGHFPKTREYSQRLSRVRCDSCSAVFRLMAPGSLAKAPRPGFQRAHERPRCPDHGEMVRKGNYQRADLGIIYRWRCQRNHCQEAVLLDRNGTPVPPTARPRKLPIIFGCDMPGCEELRTDQLDGRKRYCLNHSRLSYFQRWRVKKRLLEAMSRDQTMRSDAKIFRGHGVLNEDRRKSFGRLLRQELITRDLTPGAAARRTRLKMGTVQNWSRGVSLPRDRGKFEQFARDLGIDLTPFEGYLETG